MCWLCRWGNESDWCLSCFSAYSWNQQYSLTISFPILRFNLMWTLSEYNKSRIFRDCVSLVIIVSLFKPLFYLWTSWNHSLIAFSMNRVTKTESMRGISTMRFSLFAAPLCVCICTRICDRHLSSSNIQTRQNWSTRSGSMEYKNSSDRSTEKALTAINVMYRSFHWQHHSWYSDVNGGDFRHIWSSTIC